MSTEQHDQQLVTYVGAAASDLPLADGMSLRRRFDEPAATGSNCCSDVLAFRIDGPCSADEALACLGASRPMRARVFASGQLARDGALLGRTDRLDGGDIVALRPLVMREPGPTSDEPVRILYEDGFILAADKPQGLLVHGDGTGAETLTARVQGHLRRRGSLAVPQALQRLDVDTSGVVLFSKVEEFQGVFDALVSGHADVLPAGRAGVCKTYLAVVCGSFGSPTCDCAEPIGRDRHDARRMRVSQTGQPALTHVRRVAIDEGGRSGRGGGGRDGGSHTLLAVTLGTGRRHQIRVHLAHLGYPIVNDPLYGMVESPDGLMLHAYSESFIHPITHEQVDIVAGWPERFGAWFDESQL